VLTMIAEQTNTNQKLVAREAEWRFGRPLGARFEGPPERPLWVVHGRPRDAKRAFGDDKKVKIAAVHPDFGAASPLSLMGCADWRPNRKRALEVRRPKRALPTTVSPVLPSWRARLSNLGLESAFTL